MNANRRKQLQRAIELLDEAKTIIDSCRDEEQEYVDSMPENLQNSEKAEKANEVVSQLDEVIYAIEENVTVIEEVIQ